MTNYAQKDLTFRFSVSFSRRRYAAPILYHQPAGANDQEREQLFEKLTETQLHWTNSRTAVLYSLQMTISLLR